MSYRFLFPRSGRLLIAAFIMIVALYGTVRAADLPLAGGSPLAGFAFDDKPLGLPVQENFQMALLTAGSELGRSCGKTEAYGWRMGQNEQGRVDQIFNNTVDRLRALGYIVEAQSPSSVSKDVTLFTADSPRQHFIFMWSAGEIGLVMVLCESTAPLNNKNATASMPTGSIDPGFKSPAAASEDVLTSTLNTPVQDKAVVDAARRFTPVGSWVGNYSCSKKYTGGTLKIDSFSGKTFQGMFSFYPTAKNRNVAAGSYSISGQYDKASYRTLINPGKWIKRPKGFSSTIMVGRFDPISSSFSGFFQGVSGCTSFEAKRDSGKRLLVAEKKKSKTLHKSTKKAASKASGDVIADPTLGKTITPPPSPGITPESAVAAPPPLTTPKAVPVPASVTPAPMPSPPTTSQPVPPLPSQVLPPPAPAAQNSATAPSPAPTPINPATTTPQ